MSTWSELRHRIESPPSSGRIASLISTHQFECLPHQVGASSPGRRTFSSISAALFADSGWYEVNETKIEPLAWGHHAGCDFLDRPCSEWSQPRYTCTREREALCSYDRRGMAYCDITSFQRPLPAEHQYFEDPYACR